MGAGSPLTGRTPKPLVMIRPFAKASVWGVIRIAPGVAICSIRAARWVVCPTAV